MKELFELQTGIYPRWASCENRTGQKGSAAMTGGGRKGSAYIPVQAHSTVTLACEKGTSGIVRRMWMTMSDMSQVMLRGLRLKCYWDGDLLPAVNTPLGDFFAMSTGRVYPLHSSLLSSPEGRSFVHFIQMPFRESMRIDLENTTDFNLRELYYDVDYTIGDSLGDEVLYFHAWYNHQNETVIREDFQVLPMIHGQGRFLGLSIGIICDQDRYSDVWWGEGEMKFFLDGDIPYPTLCNTGAEDYISTGYGVNGFSDLYSGCHECDKQNMRFSFYRFHIPDPIFFYESIRVTWQQIGAIDSHLFHDQKKLYFLQMKNGEPYMKTDGSVLDIPAIDTSQIKPILFERTDEVSSTAYFYHASHHPQIEPVY